MSDDMDNLDVEKEEEEESPSNIRYDIASYPSDLTLAGVKVMWESGDIAIPSFQRNFVWSIKQSSLLIDSFLCGLPVPPVFFYITEENLNLVIDGQQRIMSIVYFLNGYFGREDHQRRKQVFRLELSKKHPYNGFTFDDLPESDKRKLQHSSVLRAINIRQLNPEDKGTSAYHIFERLNTGGTPLTPQEIRNCVFMGEFSELLKDLNNDSNWRKIIGKPAHDKHQKDVELILRVFAMYCMRKSYEKPMKEFLNSAMRKYRDGGASEVLCFKDRFPLVAKYVIDTLGERPFHIRGPLNMSALDSVMATLIENHGKTPGDLKPRFATLRFNDTFISTTTLGSADVANVSARFRVAKDILIG